MLFIKISIDLFRGWIRFINVLWSLQPNIDSPKAPKKATSNGLSWYWKSFFVVTAGLITFAPSHWNIHLFLSMSECWKNYQFRASIGILIVQKKEKVFIMDLSRFSHLSFFKTGVFLPSRSHYKKILFHRNFCEVSLIFPQCRGILVN